MLVISNEIKISHPPLLIKKNSDIIKQQDNDNNYNDDAMNMMIEASLDVDQDIKT